MTLLSLAKGTWQYLFLDIAAGKSLWCFFVQHDGEINFYVRVLWHFSSFCGSVGKFWCLPLTCCTRPDKSAKTVEKHSPSLAGKKNDHAMLVGAISLLRVAKTAFSGYTFEIYGANSAEKKIQYHLRQSSTARRQQSHISRVLVVQNLLHNSSADLQKKAKFIA